MLSADRPKMAADWDDVSYVTATVVDENGVMVPGESDAVSFKVAGPGVIAAVDSADNASREAFQASERRAFQGWCVAVLKAGAAGRIAVTASAPGLAAGSITIVAMRER